MKIEITTFPTLITILILCRCPTEGIYTISDDRIRSLDINPVLGRGYSIMTNQFHSTCLVVDDTTVPSYNYDYYFTDFTQDDDIEKQQGKKVAGTFGFIFTRGEMSVASDTTEKTKTKTHVISATMRIERYYSSVKEEKTVLADDALTLLDAEDYVGFFQACGPNYTRGIRRAQEVTAVFRFNSSSREVAKKFAASLKVRKWTLFKGTKTLNTSFSKSSKFKNESKSLQISIRGYGLGLNQVGSESLVATTLEGYDRVMKFAFNTMTKNDETRHIGMVYGIEVVPWVHNSAFQVAAKMHDENIIVPLPRTLIPKAFMIDQNAPPVEFKKSTRLMFRCKETSFEIDRFGYCCEPEALYNRTSREYELGSPEEKICKPVRQLDRSLVKDNMANNGEFVSRLASAMRYKLTQIGVVEKCISAANAIPSRFDFNILKAQDSVKYDKAIDTSMTLFDLKTTLDPLGDYSIIKHLGKELDEWIEMFYSPCFASLYGTHIDNTPDLDISFFMAYPWHAHKECLQLSCLANNMRWDRGEGGCVPSLLVGASAPGYDDGKDTFCSSDLEKTDTKEECKYKQTELKAYHGKVTECWKNTDFLSVGPIDYFIEYFCMPQLTKNKVSAEMKQDMIDAKSTHCQNI